MFIESVKGKRLNNSGVEMSSVY